MNLFFFLGILLGFMYELIICQHTYINVLKHNPGISAPKNKSVTLTDSGEKFPKASCAC